MDRPRRPLDQQAFVQLRIFAGGHIWLLIAGAALLTLHILAALRHHFVLRDATLRRILRG